MAKNNSTIHKSEILKDYHIANVSRQCSIAGRKEVLTGKAKFGIFGDGKEIAQLALSKVFKDGDWRSGYYRDQTLMMALGLFSASGFFHQLYGQTNVELNPGNGGRSFNNHFSTRSLDKDGEWKNLSKQKNSSADISPTAGQMPRLVGLAYASKLFRQNEELHRFSTLSDKGNEVAFGTIGDASTSEGHFFEALSAACVLKVPFAISIWDDGYGISVPKKYQTAKQSISDILKGFEYDEKRGGALIYKGKGWDYDGLIKMYQEGISRCRAEHIPVVFHVEEITQPQGHSTSGSHERYKTAERLEWERQFDPILKMRDWILKEKIASADELDKIENDALEEVKLAKQLAWKEFTEPLIRERDALVSLIDQSRCHCAKDGQVDLIKSDLQKLITPIRKDTISASKKILRHLCQNCSTDKPLKAALADWINNTVKYHQDDYSSYLYASGKFSVLNVKEVKPVFDGNQELVAGREILRDNYDYIFAHNPRVVIFGEDVGNIGGVNQTLEGLQKKYGELRITDTGIRENTILGQGIGLALRGLRPIVEIQYFDYLLYALQTLSDDLATTHYRTKGGQRAPVIISTRGHRLEGIWHSGSPLSMVINSIRGVYVCVPRNMTQAAGFYNTLLEAEDIALVIEPLNGYRLKELKPLNIGEYKIPLGHPEILNEGTDVTLVTYGSCVRIAQDAVKQLAEFNISVELIDVQTLLPFDLTDTILNSLKKTNRVVFFDEDVPGGATAFMMQNVLERDNGYVYLDSAPVTITGQEHRPAYSTDGDYFSNPSAETVFDAIYAIMHESNPLNYPKIY